MREPVWSCLQGVGWVFLIAWSSNVKYSPDQRQPWVRAYLPRLAVFVDLGQTGGLLRGGERLKLAEIGEVGLLRNLLGGGGGEHGPAPWHSLCIHTMAGVWH